MKVKNSDVRQALNILSIAKEKQLKEIESMIISERDACPPDDNKYFNDQLEVIEAIRKVYK